MKEFLRKVGCFEIALLRKELVAKIHARGAVNFKRIINVEIFEYKLL